MSYKRYIIDLAFEEPLSASLEGKLGALENTVRNIKPFASRINEGKDSEEATDKATWHICNHDAIPYEPCEPEWEI